MTLFAKPQGNVRVDRGGSRSYVGLRNALHVHLEGNESYTIHIVPPTDVFSVLFDIYRISVEKLTQSKTGFYLDYDDGLYFFGVFVGDTYADLWTYKTLPSWACLE